MAVEDPYTLEADHWPGLAKLAEEAGELIQVLGKIMALGVAGGLQHWDGTNVRDRVLEELADLTAAMNFFMAFNATEDEFGRILIRATEKTDKFHAWRDKQQGDEADA